MKRELLEDAVKVAAIFIICAPILPDARTGWFMAMRACQNASRHFGLLAIEAEKHYHEAKP